MASTPIKNVLVISAGSVGSSAIKALLKENFTVTLLTSESSTKPIPSGVQHVRSDYSPQSLLAAFKNQDAIVSTISGAGLEIQKSIVDAAIASGVKRFIPSEYGVDTSVVGAKEVIPLLGPKITLLDYIKSQQEKISWTAVITGSLFDWGLRIPGFGGIDVGKRTATIYDGGKTAYEATNLDQAGKAIALALKAHELTRNQYVYVNSFTATQEQVVRALERASGEKFAITHSTVQKMRDEGFAELKKENPYGMLPLIASGFYGDSGLASYRDRLWNDRLGLEGEDLEEFAKEFMAEK